MVLIMLYVSGTYHLPMILLAIPVWYVWLLRVSSKPTKCLLPTAGFVLMAIGYWCETSLWHYFATRVEMSHVRADGDYWSGMAVVSEQVATVLTLSGLLVLAYADYLRSSKPKQVANVSNEKDTNTSQVWPPTPKLP